MRKIKWYYDTVDGVLYDANGYQEGARVPAIYAGELAAVEVQLCVGAPQFDEQGELTNPDASYATTAATGEFVVDNDYNHVSGVSLGEALTSGVAVNAIKITAGGAVRPLGTIRLDASHAVNYCAAERDASGKWVLTTANDTYTAAPYTPSANYDAGAPAVMVDMPIIVGSNPDASDKATGIFRAELDANNPVYLQLCEDTAQIGGTMIEFSVYVDGRPVLKWRTLLDCLSAIALPPSQEYYPPDTYPALDSRYIRISGGTSAYITAVGEGLTFYGGTVSVNLAAGTATDGDVLFVNQNSHGAPLVINVNAGEFRTDGNKPHVRLPESSVYPQRGGLKQWTGSDYTGYEDFGLGIDVDCDIFGGTASLADDHADLQGKQNAPAVTHVTPLASGEAEVSPVGSNVYVVDGEIDKLIVSGFAVDSAEVWTVTFKFSASAAATVQIVPPTGTLSYDTVGEFTFEAGKAYVISCQYGMLVRGERTEVVI